MTERDNYRRPWPSDPPRVQYRAPDGTCQHWGSSTHAREGTERRFCDLCDLPVPDEK